MKTLFKFAESKLIRSRIKHSFYPIFLFLLNPVSVDAVAQQTKQKRFDERNNGAYGRFEDDLHLSIGVGGQLYSQMDRSPSFFVLGESQLTYLHTAGIIVAGAAMANSPFQLMLGGKIHPLFPGLLFTGNDTENRFLDLWIQSWSLEMGAQINVPSVSKLSQSGLFVGTNWSIPLFPWNANLPWCWLKLGARYHHLFTSSSEQNDTQSWSVVTTLEFRIPLGTYWSHQEPFD